MISKQLRYRLRAPACHKVQRSRQRRARHSFSHTFLSDAANPGGFAHVMYEPSLRLTPGPGAETLYHLVDPYFERSWDAFSGHDYTPAGP